MSGSKRKKVKPTDPQIQASTIQPKPHSEQLKQLRQIIENRFKDEPDKQLIQFLLSKAKLDESQLIDKLLRKMLLIKEYLLKSRFKDKKRVEELILAILYPDSLTERRLNDELLDDKLLIEELLKDSKLISMIFKETFVYIPRNPKLEESVDWAPW